MRPTGLSSMQRPQNLLLTSRSASTVTPTASQCAASTVGWCTTFSATQRKRRRASMCSYVSPSSGLNGLHVRPTEPEYLQETATD